MAPTRGSTGSGRRGLDGKEEVIKEAGRMEVNALVINPRDNVAVVLKDVPRGGTVRLAGGESLQAIEDIPCSHKVALVDIPKGTEVIKYGEIIGRAAENIARGSWVHTHNLVLEE